MSAESYDDRDRFFISPFRKRRNSIEAQCLSKLVPRYTDVHVIYMVTMTINKVKHKTGVVSLSINSLRPRQNGRHFTDDIFNCVFLNENVWIPNKISLKFVRKGPIINIPALLQLMAWRHPYLAAEWYNIEYSSDCRSWPTAVCPWWTQIGRTKSRRSVHCSIHSPAG